jgi:hypothetical protein
MQHQAAGLAQVVSVFKVDRSADAAAGSPGQRGRQALALR